MKIFRLIGVSALSTCVALAALAQPLPKVSNPEDVGFSPERLKRLTDMVRTEIDKRAIPGAVMLIARNGKVAYLDALGFRDREENGVMKPDSRIRE